MKVSELERKWLRELELLRQGFIENGCSRDEAQHQAWIPFNVWLAYNKQIERIRDNDWIMRGEDSA